MEMKRVTPRAIEEQLSEDRGESRLLSAPAPPSSKPPDNEPTREKSSVSRRAKKRIDPV